MINIHNPQHEYDCNNCRHEDNYCGPGWPCVLNYSNGGLLPPPPERKKEINTQCLLLGKPLRFIEE